MIVVIRASFRAATPKSAQHREDVPHELFELNSLMAIAMMVDRGLGVSLMPDIVSPLTAGLEVAKLPLPVKTEPRRFGVVWHRASPRGRLIKGFLQCADEALQHDEPKPARKARR